MQKYNGQLIRQFASQITGNAAAGVLVTVREKLDDSIATLYVSNDIAGATLPNPMLTTDKGFFSFYAADGVYRVSFSDGTPERVIQLKDFSVFIMPNNEWVRLPAVYKFILRGTGWATVDIESINGAVSIGVSQLEVAGSPVEVFEYFGAYKIRVQYTGTATMELI